MSARVLRFPCSAILRAVRQLERPVSPEAEGLAASVLIEALAIGDAVPPGTLSLVCSAVLRHARTGYGIRLAEKLADLHDNLEVLILGDVLLKDASTRAAGLAVLRRLG